jgi:hypothetical protein
VHKRITMGSVGSVSHMREIFSFPRNANACLPVFFVLPDLYDPNRNSNLDHSASIDANFLKEVPFRSGEICKRSQMS